MRLLSCLRDIPLKIAVKDNYVVDSFECVLDTVLKNWESLLKALMYSTHLEQPQLDFFVPISIASSSS